MTAQELAEEMEVSVRTIYRDLDALSAAGIPLYTERGPGGGCALLEDYRTNLTGLKETEVQALFMLSIPSPLAKLGVSQELKTALLKLSAALPNSHQANGLKVRQRIHLDSTWWFQSQDPTPHLQKVHKAVWEDRKLRLSYRLRFENQIERMIEPFGLVAKAGIWYVLYARDGRYRILRISEILDAELTDHYFKRPPKFDLEKCWERCSQDYENNQPSYTAHVLIDPIFLGYLPHYFGDPIREKIRAINPSKTLDWIEMTLNFQSFDDARTRILGFGSVVKVLKPEALRLSVRDYANQVANLYQDA
jgi:predicted DNA-binding transcriptional regulator YafY